MAKVIQRAIHDRQRPLRREARIPFGAYTLRLSVEASAEIVNAAKRRPGPHNQRRHYVETLLVRRLHEQYEGLLGRTGRVGVRGQGPEAGEHAVDPNEFGDDLLGVAD